MLNIFLQLIRSFRALDAIAYLLLGIKPTWRKFKTVVSVLIIILPYFVAPLLKPVQAHPAATIIGVYKLKPEVAAQIDNEVAKYSDRCAGTTIGLVYDSTIVYTASYGSHGIEQSHEWGSVSKTLTGLVNMRLVERGQLTLDTPIWDYVPLYGTLIPEPYKVTPLNLQHLLTHMGGVSDSGQVHTPQMFIAEPGTQYIYSTNGFGIIGEVLTSTLNLNYPTIVKTEIADLVDAASLTAAKGFVSPGALVKSDIQDFSKYMVGIIQNTFVSSDTLYNKMLVTYAVGYQGLAFHTSGSGKNLAITHGGSNGTEKADLYLKPRLKRGVGIFCDAAYPWSDSTVLRNLSKSLDSILAAYDNPCLSPDGCQAEIAYDYKHFLPLIVKDADATEEQPQ